MGYKVGDKFIVEIEDKFKKTYEVGENPVEPLYRIKGFNSLVFDENGLNKLEKYEKLPSIPVSALDVERRAGYEDGLNDAWEAAKIIGAQTTSKLMEMGFIINPKENPYKESFAVFDRYSIDEAMSKIKTYEEQKKAEKKAEIGDEIVCVQTREKGFILCVQDETGRTHAMVEGYDCPQVIFMEDWKRTGKHYDIEGILKAMREE